MGQIVDFIRSRNLQVVDEWDHVTGLIGNQIVGVRASHVFLRTADHRLLVQVTGESHRHPGLIGSSVAGFLYPDETYLSAVRRRSREELGIELEDLSFLGTSKSPELDAFKYSGVFLATPSGRPQIELEGHVGDLQVWATIDLQRALAENPATFTPTFPYVFPLVASHSDQI